MTHRSLGNEQELGKHQEVSTMVRNTSVVNLNSLFDASYNSEDKLSLTVLSGFVFWGGIAFLETTRTNYIH